MTASLDASPPGVAPPPQRRPSGGLTFRPPVEEERAEWGTATGDHLTPEELGTTDLDNQLAGSPSASAWQPAESAEDDENDPTSSRSGSGDSVRPLTKKAQQAAARTAVKVASGMAHTYLARTEEARAVGMFLADDEDAAAIGDPLARIVGRRAGSSGAVANPDVADGIAAMLGLAGFVAKQIDRTRQMADVRVADAKGSPEAVDV